MNKQEYIKKLNDVIKHISEEKRESINKEYEKKMSHLKEDEDVVIGKYGHPLGLSSYYNAEYYVNKLNEKKRINKNGLLAIYYGLLSVLGLPLPLYVSIPIVVILSLITLFFIFLILGVLGLCAFLGISGLSTLIVSLFLFISDVGTAFQFLGIALLLLGGFGLTFNVLYYLSKYVFIEAPIYFYKLVSKFKDKMKVGLDYGKKS